MSCVFDATTNYVSKLVCDGQGLLTANTTNYWPPSGQVSGITALESNVQHKVKKAGTLKNLCVPVASNARTTDTSVTVRVNGASTGITLTIPPLAAGFIEDTTHTASVAVDDLIDFMTVTGTGTETLVPDNLMIEYETTSGHGFITGGSLGATAELATPANTTGYMVPSGENKLDSTEANVKLKTRIPLTLSNLTISVRVNTVSAPSTLKMRINGLDGNQTITIPANTTGYFHDTTHTDTVDADDEIDYQLITGATGTSMTIRQIAVWSLPEIEVTPVTGLGGRSRQGRSPLYRLTKPKVVAVIIRLKVQLEYEVTRLTITVAIPYVFEKVTLIKYASAVIEPVVNVLPLRKRPTPKAVVRTIITQLPYEVQTLRLRSACAYEVDKLITRKKHLEILRIAMNYLMSRILLHIQIANAAL